MSLDHPLALLALLLIAATVNGAEDQEAIEAFEREVRPILVEHCIKCHGAEKQESDLRLDTRNHLLKGGVSGPAIESGVPEKSLLIAAIRQEGELKMPPKSKLSDVQIASLNLWIKRGAPWPKDATPTSADPEKGRNHWAFQPVKDPAVPVIAGREIQNPIDAFVLAKLAEKELLPGPSADRRTLIRRATYDLTGLPPSPEEVAEFEADADPAAYAKLIDRLLASAQYGEQGARHWLDVARYSDTKGYVYAREQRTWIHSWIYRDWVVKSLNEDIPYDRFLKLQIAADQVAPEDKQSLAAMGFLTLGRRFLGVQRDIIDDRIDVVMRGTMGLTVGCARCHDHKFDPIPTRDYYSLYGVFQSCAEKLVQIEEPTEQSEAYLAFEKERAVRLQKLTDTMATRRSETAGRVRAGAADYLAAQLELSKYPEEGFDQIITKTDLIPNFVRKWQAYLAERKKAPIDPIFAPWFSYAALKPEAFAEGAAEVAQSIKDRREQLNPLVAQKFETVPEAMTAVAKAYGELFTAIEVQWNAARQSDPAILALPDPAAESLRQVLFDPQGPCVVPDEAIVNIEYFFDMDSLTELWRLQNELENWIFQSPVAPKVTAILVDRETPTVPRVFKRGNPANKGDEVPRQFVSAVAGAAQKPFAKGSGRLELAEDIVDPKNPLTGRVMVNRIWQHHFGSGLVATPSDFGTRCAPPSHPELLDWLVCRFIQDGWSIKKMHRRIMLSETYQRSVAGPGNQEQLAKATLVDPTNRLLWRANSRRLTFEEMRDSFLVAAGKLDRTVGGKVGNLFDGGFTRRSLYGNIDRQFLPSTLRIFDFANPDLHIPQRSETTVPQQALYFLNHQQTIGYAQALAARTAQAKNEDDRVQQLFQIVYQRAATAEQVAAARELVANEQQNQQDATDPQQKSVLGAWEQLAQVLLSSNEFLFVD